MLCYGGLGFSRAFGYPTLCLQNESHRKSVSFPPFPLFCFFDLNQPSKVVQIICSRSAVLISVFMFSVTSLPQTTTMRHRFKSSMDICASPCWSSALLSSKNGTNPNLGQIGIYPQFINLSAVFLHLYSAVLFRAAHIRKRSIHISSPFGRHPYGCPKFLSQKTDILLDIHFFFQCFSHSFRSQLEVGICHFNPHCLVSLLGSRKNRSTCSGKRI